jgi:hypothetical protein
VHFSAVNDHIMIVGHAIDSDGPKGKPFKSHVRFFSDDTLIAKLCGCATSEKSVMYTSRSESATFVPRLSEFDRPADCRTFATPKSFAKPD